MTEQRRNDSGFTLLELLIAVALLGLLSFILASSMRFGVQVWARSHNALETAHGIREAQTALMDGLARAYPLSGHGSNGQADFDGATGSIAFVAPSETLPGALERVSVSLEPDGDDNVIVKRATLELARGGDTRRTILCRHVKTLSFEYFGADSQIDEPTWRKEWRNKPRLPSLVRVRMTLDGMPKSLWSQFVVATRLASDVGCVFDPLTKSCRGR
jgi:general secretion pathway protein J